jgi:hypothetical protein
MDLTDTYRIFHQILAEYTFFSVDTYNLSILNQEI